ncbi:hypothetical protein GPECTOR_1g408 [Gonium pectorale]|uniref:Macrocin O-methyltransferase n=1 Tax=Gonium pectorale TaxID=33097 RepID=A0A150H2Q3_GONPE|nr:hypothetical protein GPECTOR_1g408 [Gonium pectorale]|eukprot:KXZ56456.1 hypothetical protein GPECTOR_1g408 [Gonium pectorale]
MLTVPGDIVETGVYKGGSGIFMCMLLKEWDLCGRTYWGYDSFQGLPEPVAEDQGGSGMVGTPGMFNFGLKKTYANFAKYGLTDPTLVKLVPGWFNETLPNAEVKQIAFLRLDGDMFTSTHEALMHLYSKVPVGGIVYVDDYGGFNGCRLAVDTFRTLYGITSPLNWVREGDDTVEAVWWRKGGRLHNDEDNEIQRTAAVP